MYWPDSPYTWTFLIATAVQACLIIAMESYIFAKFQISLQSGSSSPQSQTIPTYLSLFIFGFVYHTILVYDSLRLKNTIQVIGLCLYNLGMLVYAAVQYDQIHTVVQQLDIRNAGEGVAHIDNAFQLWQDIRPYLIAVPCIIGFFSIILVFVASRLYNEFAWTIYKKISADVRMRDRFRDYQIYITLLKFDFFFFLGFTVQFLVIVGHQKVDSGPHITIAEMVLTAVAVPVTIFILLGAAFWTRRENKTGSYVVLFLYVAGLAYFIFKLVRMYQPIHETQYLPVRNSLTVFAAITVLLITLTIGNAIQCLRNYDQGLAPLIKQRKIDHHQEKELGMTELNDVTKMRMTID